MQVFLVGDPVQLPATVISGRADKHGYSTSLFKRLQTSGFPVQVTAAVYCMALSIDTLCQSVTSDPRHRHSYGDVLVALRAMLLRHAACMAMAALLLRT